LSGKGAPVAAARQVEIDINVEMAVVGRFLKVGRGEPGGKELQFQAGVDKVMAKERVRGVRHEQSDSGTAIVPSPFLAIEVEQGTHEREYDKKHAVGNDEQGKKTHPSARFCFHRFPSFVILPR